MGLPAIREDVVADQGVARLDEIRGHRRAHDAEADHADGCSRHTSGWCGDHPLPDPASTRKHEITKHQTTKTRNHETTKTKIGFLCAFELSRFRAFVVSCFRVLVVTSSGFCY